MTATRANLVAAVQNSIGLLAPIYRDSATESDLYEASLLTIAVEAAEAAGATCLITGDGSTPSQELCFRRSPGNLWLGSHTYVRATFPASGKQVEIHLGVYVMGHAKVPHECDVAILDHDEAERSRQKQVHPRCSHLISAIEAKFYALSPGLGVGRGFLGLSAELGSARCYLAFPARQSMNIGRLLAARPCESFEELIPGTPPAQRLRNHLEQQLRNWVSKGRS